MNILVPSKYVSSDECLEQAMVALRKLGHSIEVGDWKELSLIPRSCLGKCSDENCGEVFTFMYYLDPSKTIDQVGWKITFESFRKYPLFNRHSGKTDLHSKSIPPHPRNFYCTRYRPLI